MPRLLPFRGCAPTLHPDAFVAPGATLVGDVEVGPGASVWFGCVLRGDVAPIRIGAGTNVQDLTVVHTTRTGIPTIVGTGVTVGHRCILHACTVEDGAFVGMGSILMDRAVVESGAMVAAGTLVTGEQRIRAGELWAGRPARRMRELRAEERVHLRELGDHYVELAAEYRTDR